MAFPAAIDPTAPVGTDSPAQGDDEFRALKQFIVDVLGIPPSPSTIAAPIGKVGTDGQAPIHVRLTNRTAGGLIAGDVVALSTANDKSVVLADTSASRKPFVVARETIADTAEGLFVYGGVVSAKAQGAIAIGDYVRKSATTKAVETTGVAIADAQPPPTGTVGVALSTVAGGFVTVFWWAGGGAGINNTQTRSDKLAIESATLATGTGTGNNPPELFRDESSAAQTANTPKRTPTYAKFDAATDEHLEFTYQLPPNYLSGGTLRGKLKMATATTNNVIMKAGASVTTDASSDDDALAFIAGDLSAAIAAPGTQGQTVEFTITLTTTGWAPNKIVTIFIGRDADNGSDNMTGDAILCSLRVETLESLS